MYNADASAHILFRPENRIHFAFLLTREDPSSFQSENVIHESSREVDIVQAFVPSWEAVSFIFPVLVSVMKHFKMFSIWKWYKLKLRIIRLDGWLKVWWCWDGWVRLEWSRPTNIVTMSPKALSLSKSFHFLVLPCLCLSELLTLQLWVSSNSFAKTEFLNPSWLEVESC